jgi:hypothetical protein
LFDIKFISAGYRSGIVLDHSGNLFAFGNNTNGQLGLGDTIDRVSPCKIEGFKNIVQISCGFWHSLFLGSNGEVWSCGYNYYGQLGNSSGTTIPKLIPNLKNIIQIYGAGHSSIFKNDQQQVFVLGDSTYFQLGFETKENFLSPTEQKLWRNKTIIPGAYHNSVVDEEGFLWFYGSYLKFVCQGKHPAKISFADCSLNFQGHEAIDRLKERIFTSGYVEDDLLSQPVPIVAPLDDLALEKKLIQGNMSWKHWKKAWVLLKEHQQTLQENHHDHQTRLSELENRIQQLEIQFLQIETELNLSKQEAEQIRQGVEFFSKQMNQCEMLDELISLWKDKLRSLKKPFLDKIRTAQFDLSSLNSQEVLVFLNLLGISELVSWFEANQFDGHILETISDSELKKQGIPLNKRLLFFAGVQNLLCGKFANKEHILECPVCQCVSVEEQRLFWKEWEID